MKKVIFLILVCLLCLPIILPFLKPGIFPTQDGEWAMVRLAEMHREIKDLQIPPRWSNYLNHGFGYPLFLFTYPLPYYLAEIFNLVGLDLITSIKVIFSLSVIGSALTMFYFSRKLWGNWGAWVSTSLYLYAPYRFVNLFIRGSIGESLAFAFFPLLLWLFQRLAENRKPTDLFWAAIILALFVGVHNALVILFLPFLLFWIGYLWFLNRRSFLYLLFAVVLAAILSAYFWLPAIWEKSFIALSQTPLAQKQTNFVSFRELVSRYWAFTTRPPLQLGAVHLVAGFVSIAGAFLSWYKNIRVKKKVWMIALLFSLALYMLFAESEFLWQLPLFKEIDFPWRMLAIATFLVSTLAGALSFSKNGVATSLTVIILSLIFNWQYIVTQQNIQKPTGYYSTNDATTTSADELMPIWVKQKPTNRPANKVVISQGGGIIREVNETSKSLTFVAEPVTESVIEIKTVYFPGWRAFVDETEVIVTPTAETGLINFTVSKGKHQVKLLFMKTPVRQVADIVSLSGLLILGGIWFWSKRSGRF